MPAVEICSLRSAAGMIILCQRDAVVGQEGHLQQPLTSRVAVHHIGHVVNELDDLLGGPVAGRRLAGEDDGTRHAPPSAPSSTMRR